jgi:hypothetical protein
MPVLRGFNRSVKQDSKANEVSGGVSAANVARKPTSGKFHPSGSTTLAQ